MGPHEVAAGAGTCSRCGQLARVLPGQSYSDADGGLFIELGAVLNDVQLTPRQAKQLCEVLRGRHGDEPGSALSRAVRLVPGLALLELVTGSHPMTLKKAESMLRSLCDAKAAAYGAAAPNVR
jgi:hypothetical protein